MEVNIYGSNGVPSFEASEFRTVIKQTMQMGIPTAMDERLLWHIPRIKTYENQDPTLNPYDWSATPNMDIPGDDAHPSGQVSVDYALEFSASSPGTSGQTDAARFDTARILVTMLDVDWEQVKSADYATIGRVHYDITFTSPPLGMFDVTVYQVYLLARDQA